MRKIRYKVCMKATKNLYTSIFARPNDSIYYAIGTTSRPNPIPESRGYYIAVFKTVENAALFVENSCHKLYGTTVLEVEVSGKHKVKRLPPRLTFFELDCKSLFEEGSAVMAINEWPNGTELWEKVKPIKAIYII